MNLHQSILLSGKLCLLVSLLTGCVPPGAHVSTNNPVTAAADIAKIDKEIQQLEAKIQGTKDDINQMTIEDHEVKSQLEKHILFPFDSAYAAAGGQNPGDPNDGRLVRVTNNLAVARKTLEQQKQELKNLTAKKVSLQQQSMGCFPEDALVMLADGSTKQFSSIRVGDMVQTYDIGYEKTVPRKVLEVYQVDGNHLYVINDEFRTTGGERLLAQDGWRPVGNLKVGDIIHVGGQMIEVKRIELSYEKQRLYNMQVTDTHNFYVAIPGIGPVLVHNSGGGGGK